LITLETVIAETPAFDAMSYIVTIGESPCRIIVFYILQN
jgi:hypothetical protein